jgi:hypothetical protein
MDNKSFEKPYKEYLYKHKMTMRNRKLFILVQINLFKEENQYNNNRKRT